MPTILTPVTLWKDFNCDLPLEESVVSEKREDGFVFRNVFFSGRQTQKGRVRIYAQYAFPDGTEQFPVVMILFEAGFGFDAAFIRRFLDKGYGVLSVDYCGDNGSELHTYYPQDVDYANFARVGTHMDLAEPSAKETSWYEWAGVARYAARYLAEKPEVTATGALGLRTGGEILFKIAPYAPIACMISVCAAGWLAYRGIDKFSGGQNVFGEERHRFIAGIDSQSYAPYVKCPVLLISAINDDKSDYDRVYDTFRQINPAVDKAILYSAHGNGLVGARSQENLILFFDKYLKGRLVFISRPIDISVETDDGDNLVVKTQFDPQGEIREYGIFFTEKVTDSNARDWTRVLGRAEDFRNNVGVVPLSVYSGSKKALVYSFANYSNGFSVTSKIKEVVLDRHYANSRPISRVIYTSRDGRNGFVGHRLRTRSIADCFMEGSASEVRLEAGYGGIMGITSPSGIISYRVGEPRYEPPEGASLCFDAYCAQNAKVKVQFFLDSKDSTGYSAEARVEGGGKWKSILLSPDDFKSETGVHLSGFHGVVALMFYSESEVLINNVFWI